MLRQDKPQDMGTLSPKSGGVIHGRWITLWISGGDKKSGLIGAAVDKTADDAI